MTETIKDGARYYVKENGALIIADQWDRMYKPAHGIVMKKTKSKGRNPDRTRAWLKGERSY
jgi:hypothetical protein